MELPLLKWRPSLHVSKAGYWQELESSRLPSLLIVMLRGLISATINNTVTPVANEELIAMVRDHLPLGIAISESSTAGRYYDVVVFVPDNPETGRQFFLLIPRYHGGVLKYPRDL